MNNFYKIVKTVNEENINSSIPSGCILDEKFHCTKKLMIIFVLSKLNSLHLYIIIKLTLLSTHIRLKKKY